MSRVLRSIVLGVVLLSAFTAPAVASPAAAPSASTARDVDTGRWCDWHTYKTHYTVDVLGVHPRLTNLSRHTLPPSGWHKETRSSAWQATIRASVSFDSSTSVGINGIGKILGQASAKTHLALKSSGSATYAHRVQVTSYLSNPTRQSATFPFFKGWSVAKGRFRMYFCEQNNARPRQWRIFYRPGTWMSYASSSDGAVRCGDKTARLDSVAKLAMRVGCA